MRHVADGGPVRAAYALSRAQGSAVTRNRARRRIKAVLDDCHRRGLVPGGAYLIGASGPIADRSPTELRDDLERCLGQLGREPVGS